VAVVAVDRRDEVRLALAHDRDEAREPVAARRRARVGLARVRRFQRGEAAGDLVGGRAGHASI
jgi:hypothetical protein